MNAAVGKSMIRSPLPIYVVDDDEDMRLLVSRWLEGDGYVATSCTNASSFLDIVEEGSRGVVILDLRMPGLGGLEVMEQLQERDHSLAVIVLTASNEAHDAFQAVKLGAYDYLVKPVSRQHLLARVHNACERLTLQQKVERLEWELQKQEHFDHIIGEAPKMMKLFQEANKVARSSIPIYVSGESGTGKELFARSIHKASPRSEQPYVAINCAAIPANLIESELFGHEKGAFTGATSLHRGVFERADGGTLFLDEIGELDLASQVKLLRVLQEHSLVRVGGTRDLPINVRVICATNRNLEQLAQTGEFREDLYYRLAGYHFVLPPLRERLEDVPRLAHFFLQKYQHESAMETAMERSFTLDAMEAMCQYQWPGNVRELENVVRSAMVVSEEGQISLDALPLRISREFRATASEPTLSSASAFGAAPAVIGTSGTSATDSGGASVPSGGSASLPGAHGAATSVHPLVRQLSQVLDDGAILPLADLEKMAILHALRQTKGNVDKAAKQLQIGRATLYRRIARYEDVDVDLFKQ